MISAKFAKNHQGFQISGHSGYAEAGADIVCAAVSSMTNLVCNAAASFGADAEIKQREEDAFVSWELKNPCAEATSLLKVFEQELRELEKQYPDNIRVTKF